MRPRRLTQFIGQEHVTGQGSLIRHAVEDDRLFSMILWGPPGCGKTTLAGIFAGQTESHFVHFSAVLSGVKDIREVIQKAREQIDRHQRRTVLFVDEIHRFNKSQQDAFLHHVESGLLTLIGATTENPSFEVIAPLLSRCRVIRLDRLGSEHLSTILDRALADLKDGLGKARLKLDEQAMAHLVRISDGDARTALNGLEIAASIAVARQTEMAASEEDKEDSGYIRLADLEQALQNKAMAYDKDGEEHYNLISALHKSMRGSDPDAALYWLARMLASGEDPLYIARRMVRFASEDVGNADPYALRLAMSAVEAFRFLGPPEGELALAQVAIYLATAPKSNSVYTAYKSTRATVRKAGSLPVPFHIRNAPTRLMKGMGYGKGYAYDHDFKDAYAPQAYLPDELEGSLFYFPSDRGYEKIIKQRLDRWRDLKKPS